MRFELATAGTTTEYPWIFYRGRRHRPDGMLRDERFDFGVPNLPRTKLRGRAPGAPSSSASSSAWSRKRMSWSPRRPQVSKPPCILAYYVLAWRAVTAMFDRERLVIGRRG